MTQGQPDITCTKCSTVVPWGPHCPHCRAYLEFSGIPPWHPTDPEEHVPVAAETSDEMGDGAEPDEVAQPEDVAVDGHVDSVDSVEIVATPTAQVRAPTWTRRATRACAHESSGCRVRADGSDRGAWRA